MTVFASGARRPAVLVLILVVLLLATSCSKKPKTPPRTYEIVGNVVSVDKAAHKVTLAHKDIPGFMKAMTMDFKLKDDWAFNVLQPGDELAGVLVVDPEGAYIEQVSIQKASGTKPDAVAQQSHEPSIGDSVPDFALTSQDGKRIHLAQFHGKPLLLTFIYTRCPLPDYCIRMSNNFGSIARELRQSDPQLYSQLRMLSISIDPEFDKPDVLREYAKSYAGEVDPKLEHWTFAGGTDKDVRKIAEYFGLTYMSDNGQIVHSLRTAVIDKSGKLAAMYRGNEWKPADVITDLKKLN